GVRLYVTEYATYLNARVYLILADV
ncbi:unnamed protein product, partial [Rotaria sp. Silwood1]